MSITIAQHTGTDAMGGSGSTPTITYANAQIAGNLNIIGIIWGDTTNTINSVTDTAGNIYKKLGHFAGTNIVASGDIWYSLLIGAQAAGNVVTVHFSGTPTAPEAWLVEANTTTGLWSAGPFDQGDAASGTAVATGGVTVANQPALGFACMASGGNNGFTAGTNWTILDTLADGDIDERRFLTSTGSVTATATQGASAAWLMVAGYFPVTGGFRAKLLPLGI